jgi:hypothetical protein
MERKTVRRIIEKRVGTGILSKEELARLEEDFEQTLKGLRITVGEYVIMSEAGKEVVWQAVGYRIRQRSDQNQKRNSQVIEKK